MGSCASTVANLWGRHKDFTEFNENFAWDYPFAHLIILHLMYIPSNNVVNIVFHPTMPINVGQILSSNADIIAQLVG